MAEQTRGGLDRRTFLALGGGLAAASALAACGSNTGRGPSAGGSTAAASSSGGGSTVALSQWYHQYGEKGTEQAVKRYASDYQQADVSVQWIPGDYDKKSASALLTNKGPDVFEYGNGPSIDMITGKQVVPLGDLLGDARSDFTPSLLQRMTYQGKLWGIPQVTDMQLLVYRKSMLKKAGVQPPKTLDDLLTAAKALTTDKVKGLFVGNDGGVGVLGGPILWATGHDYLTQDNQPDFAAAEVYDGLKKLHTLFTSGSLLLGAPADWSDPSAIIQGLTAMQWTGLWTFPQLKDALGDDFDVLPFPAAPGGSPSVPVGAYASCVSAKSPHVDAAKAFVKWLWVDQTDKQLDWAQSYGFHIPARKSLIEQADDLKSGSAAKAAHMVNDVGHAQTPLLWTPASSTAYSDALNKIIRSGADPASQLAAVTKTVRQELKRVSA
ncbi:MAG TPA: sugar ABC transporter substrate-binding protein [Segeticoccus sp.]|uniref:ABC transporter substrate-binding protein n=1 Tax=Segeticoccus sp. TaxID=2706531 RepID=UPI002D8020C0|nr:sugar ABC transporter substrate-binding protein [Segeticoccus sp.]HET8599705.1 sugar ABC transporter substrate-binding protein [Segeticoccus sp.]